MAAELGRAPGLEEVGARVVEHFAAVFGRTLEHEPALLPTGAEAGP